MKPQYILLNGNVRTIKIGLDVDQTIKSLIEKGHKVEKIKKPPTLRTLHKWSDLGGTKATDGCLVEPDGTCCHGKKSWFLVLGMI